MYVKFSMCIVIYGLQCMLYAVSTEHQEIILCSDHFGCTCCENWILMEKSLVALAKYESSYY